MNKTEINYWLKIQEVRKYTISIDKIKKPNKEHEEQTRKIIIAAQIILDNKDILEGGLEIYKRNKILRIAFDYFIKYYISTFKKYRNDNT